MLFPLQDMKTLHERIKFEDTRTRALRSLLFEPSTVSTGSILALGLMLTREGL